MAILFVVPARRCPDDRIGIRTGDGSVRQGYSEKRCLPGHLGTPLTAVRRAGASPSKKAPKSFGSELKRTAYEIPSTPRTRGHPLLGKVSRWRRTGALLNHHVEQRRRYDHGGRACLALKLPPAHRNLGRVQVTDFSARTPNLHTNHSLPPRGESRGRTGAGETQANNNREGFGWDSASGQIGLQLNCNFQTKLGGVLRESPPTAL
jgi:hypothetical protein